MKKRVLSMLIALALCLPLLPAPARAEEPENNVAVQANTANVAAVTIDGTTTQYTDIDAAFAAAQQADSATVKLLADVTISHDDYSGIALKKGNITLDLNGKTLSKNTRDDNVFYAKNAVFWLSPPGATTKDEFLASLRMTVRLTVQDSSADGSGRIVQPNGGPAVIAAFNTILTVNGGTIENASSVDHDDVFNHHMAPNCAVLLSGGGKAVISGGTLRGMRGVAVTGYIAKEAEGLYKDYFGIEGYNNDTYGNELTVTGGNICATTGEALIVYEKAKKIELTGGTFTTQPNAYSIWAADTEDGGQTLKGDASSLLASGYRYEYNGTECAYSEDGKGVVGSATVALRPANEYAYIDKNGNPAKQTNCTEITVSTDDISTQGWYVLKEDITISLLNISGEVNLILCDGATLTVSNYMNVTNGSTLNLYWQSAGSGKLTAATIWRLGTVTAPAGEMKQTNDASGTTFEKCFEHDWEYTNNGDTHTAMCKLCGKAEAAAHSYDTLQSTDAENHTFACACGATTTEKHTLTCTPNADGLTHSGKCSVCGYAAAAESHSFDKTDEYGKKCECGAYLAAEYNDQQYATLTSAVEAAKNGGTVTLQAATVRENITIEDGTNVTIDLNGKIWMLDNMNGAVPVLTVTGGSVTVKNGKLMSGSTSYAATAVEVAGGKLTVGEDMTIQGGMDADRQFPAIDVKGGELTLGEGTELVCGMKVSAEGKQLKDYLPEGTAFQQTAYDQEDTTGTAGIINGYVQVYVGSFMLSVIDHANHYYTDGMCACGYVCEHKDGNSREASYFQKAVCSVCGNEYGEIVPDTIAPTGSIKITERTPFQTFIKTITFGLFFKEDVTATVMAEDDSYEQAGYDAAKHAVKIEYLVSDQAFTEEDLKAQTFTDYIKAIDLTDEQSYVVYARLTDHAGNVTYLSTDGFVIDKTAPSINDFTDGQKVHICGTSYTVSIKDANLDTVTLDGDKQSGDTIPFRYSYNGVEKHTVVATDKAGNTSTVTFFQHQAHDFDSETGVCKNCGESAAVKMQIGDGDVTLYETFVEAWRSWSWGFESKPITLTLLKNVDLESSGLSISNRDLTIDLNGHIFGHVGQFFSVVPNKGETSKLTVTGAGRFLSTLQVGTNGHLTVEADAGDIQCMEIVHNTYGEDKPTNWSVSLKGGKYGEIDMRYKDKDGVTVVAAACGELVAPGYVFDKDDEVSSESHATDVTVIPCPNHDWLNGVCDNCNLPCPHENITDGRCDTCGMSIVAKDNDGKYYSDLAAAFAGVKDGGKVTLLANVNGESTFEAGKTVTLDMAGHKLSVSNTAAALIVRSGYLTVANSAGKYIDISGQTHSVSVNGGTLKFEKKVKLGGQLSVVGEYNRDTGKYTSLGTLEGGLKEGSIITGGVYADGYDDSTGKGYENVLALLPDGYAFAEYQTDGTAGSIVRANYPSLSGNLIVVAHEHGPFTYDSENLGYYCACGYEHTEHAYDKNGHCTLCDYICPHDWHSVGETEDGRWVCGDCKAEMSAKVVANETTSYYTDVSDAIRKAVDGSTVTIISKERQQSLALNTSVPANATVTLDLNGHTLGGYALKINQETSKLTVMDSSGGNGRIGLSIWRGTLEFKPENNKTALSQLAVYGGDVKLYGGRIQGVDKSDLVLGDSVRLTDLLPKGYSFGLYVSDSRSTSLSYSDASSNKMDAWKSGYDLVPEKCDHKLPGNFGSTTCPYCNAALKATVTTADGKISGYTAMTDAFTAANENSGCTLSLLADVSDTLTVKANVTISLNPNGHTVSGGVIVQKNASLTATGGTFSGEVNCVGALDLTGCQLTGDLSVSGNATLTSCPVSKPVSVNKGGTLIVDGGSLSGVTANNGGKLEFLNGNVSGTVTAKSGGKVTVSSSHIDTLTAEDNAALTISGGNFSKITTGGSGKLIDCLKEGYAFKDTNGIVDGRAQILSNVEVVEHTHSHAWNTDAHELVCACGHVKKTDNDAPVFDRIKTGETYYQNTLTFTAEDAVSGIKEVKDGDTVLTADANGNYTIAADNREHTITATDFAGNTATVSVTVYKVYKVTLPSGTGYTVTGPDTVGHGEEYIFNVRLDDGYSRVPGKYKVLASGFELSAMAGDNAYDQFRLPSVTADMTITVEGIADITAPDAEMTIGANKFKELLNSLTFGLFFKQTQTVTVSATDAGSGLDDDTAAYLVADGLFDKTSMPTEGWTSFDMKDGKGSFNIGPHAMGSVYVRVTDKDGNTAYINSDGVVVYTDSAADTESISFTRLSDEDVSFKVNLNGNAVSSLSIGDTVIDPAQYTISADGAITLKSDYLKTLAAGEYTVTVTYAPMGITYVEKDGNDAPATTEVTLTVAKAERTLNFTAPNATYDGEAYDDLTITDEPGGTVIQHKRQGADDSTYDTAAPKNVGSYTVKINVDADDNYEAKYFTADFTISPREVAIYGVKAADKTYDGSTAATITGEATLSANYDGDNLSVVKGKATFADKNVGTAKTVTFTEFELTGSAKDNYKLTAQPASVTADITAKELTVENLKVKNKVYDGTDKAELDGTPTLKGVEKGDDVQLNFGTSSFASTDVGENIAVHFTTFTLTGADSGNYTLTQPTGITANIAAWLADGSEYSVNSGEWINTDFTVTAKAGYQLSLTNTANGTWADTLTASEETADGKLTFYMKNTATGVISSAVAESYKIDRTAPTGTITFNERTSFQKFLNTITFGLFYKDDVTVKLIASDDASGVKFVEYHKADKALTLAEVKALADSDWTAADSVGITAEDMAQFIIYARITDNAGNITYLSSNGAEFDTTVPEIIGVEDGKTYYVTRRVAVDDKNLGSVTVNGNPVDKNTPFKLIGDTDAVYTIVATDKAGNVTEYTVTMKPISAITDAIKDITADNVTSADADTIDQVSQQILDIAAESDENVIGEEQWSKLTEAAANCKKLEQRIAEVSAEINRLTDAVGSYDIDKVTSAGRTDIEQLITDIDTLLGGGNLTDTERAALEALKQTAQALLDRIAAAKSATEADEIVAVKDVTKDNVTLDDKEALEKAEKALEKALDDFDDNYTDDERKALNGKLDTVKAALDAIENTEKAAAEIKKLPSADDVKLSDKGEVERVSKIIDALTENEKAMLGEDTLGKLKALNEKLTELADNAKKPTSPSTGDTSDLALWIALLFVSGGVVTATTVISMKKKHSKE